MVYLTLDHYSFKNVHMTIGYDGEFDIELNNEFSFRVDYSEDHKTCFASISHAVRCKDEPEKFSILVEGTGQFSCEGIASNEDKREVHVRAYELLFPYLQGMITRLTVDAGLPPLKLQMARIRSEDIQFDEDE